MKSFYRWFSTGMPWGLALLLILQGCTTPPAQKLPAPIQDQPLPEATSGGPSGKASGALKSGARTPKDYRRDAARHLYERQADRIYKGRLPPMLYAVGVLDVDIDRSGQVQSIRWMRAPRHAPEVIAEIEKMVRAAAPYPVAEHLGKVTYTDVWLWHKSGRFQLDTLTEGQD